MDRCGLARDGAFRTGHGTVGYMYLYLQSKAFDGACIHACFRKVDQVPTLEYCHQAPKLYLFKRLFCFFRFAKGDMTVTEQKRCDNEHDSHISWLVIIA